MKSKGTVFLVPLLILVLAALACNVGGILPGGEQEPEPTQPPAAELTQESAELPASSESGEDEPAAADAAAAAVEIAPVEAAPVERPADGMMMAYIPAGEFVMGDDASAFKSEKPAHVVFLDGYWMDQNEVSNAQYRLCVQAGACSEPRVFHDTNLNADDQPTLVPWEGAQVYCQWVGGRLPTDAEWEKAARGPEGFIWPWGNIFEDGRANLSGDVDGYGFTAPVGSFPSGASPYGLLDMAGNAGEWVADWFDAEYYALAPYDNPTGPAGGERKVHRSSIGNGGGGPEKCRCLARYAGDVDWDFGFRCVLNQPPKETMAPAGETPEASEPLAAPSDAGGMFANPEESLDSYRMRTLMRPVGEGGLFGSQELLTEIEWVREPEARRTIMYSPQDQLMMELIVIGDDTWMDMGDGNWIHTGADLESQASPAQDQFITGLEDILKDMAGGMEPTGTDTVNGVRCQRYVVDSHFVMDLPLPEEAAEQALQFMPTEIEGDIRGEIWVADQLGLPQVIIRSETTQEITLKYESRDDEKMNYEEQRDLYDINTSIIIQAPEGAMELPSPPAGMELTTPGGEAGKAVETANLAALDSYRVDWQVTMQMADGAGMTTGYTLETVREPPAQHLVLNMGMGSWTEFIWVDNTTWYKMGDTWARETGDDTEALIEQMDSALQPDGDMVLVGQETVNGVHCKHYLMEYTTISQEIWVADQNDLPPVPIRGMFRMETGGTTMEVAADLYDINTPITIEAPQ